MKKQINELPEYDYLKPASTQDCTGLIPSGIVDENELEHYEQLYPFLPPIFSKENISTPKQHKKL